MTTEQGFAIRRNGSCLSGFEIDCGQTLAPFHGCCPIGFECPPQYNVACCPPTTNCTEALLPEPKCSNSTWDLFDNRGYFCCEHGLPGYDNQGTDGCASPGYQFEGGEAILSTVQAGQVSTPSSNTSTASVTSSTASSATASATNASPTDSSSTPVGAIAGGVLGGIAAIAILALLAWYILRHKRQRKPQASPYVPAETHGMAMKHELDENQAVNEADGGAAKYAHARELPAHQPPAELPTHGARP